MSSKTLKRCLMTSPPGDVTFIEGDVAALQRTLLVRYVLAQIGSRTRCATLDTPTHLTKFKVTLLWCCETSKEVLQIVGSVPLTLQQCSLVLCALPLPSDDKRSSAHDAFASDRICPAANLCSSTMPLCRFYADRFNVYICGVPDTKPTTVLR